MTGEEQAHAYSWADFTELNPVMVSRFREHFGAFNGAWWALFTSFAWPWIMPERLDRWMYGNTE